MNELYDDIYGIKIYFMAGCSHQTFNDAIEKKFNLDAGFTKDDEGGCLYLGNSAYAVWIRKKRDWRTLNHESLHLSIAVFKSRNISIETSEEAFIYYVNSINSKIWRHYNGKTKKT